jgi:protein-S-isoprenylcysteine O-methyltransferase Ste14
MSRVIVFVYGLICYLIFLGTFLYAVGFIGNFGVPKSMDSGPQAPFAEALIINAALLGIFAIQHSVMARQWFKNGLTKIIPPAAERSTYVLMSSLLLILLFSQWRPMGGIVWDVQNETGRLVLRAMFAFGWLTVLTSTFLINHFDLFGLRQVYLHLQGREYVPLPFRTPGPYNYVRHPLYVGWLFAFWSTPTMTVAHLVFAIATTAYILLAIQFEERDLIRLYGEAYRQYRKSVRMLVPGLGQRSDVIPPRPKAKAAGSH